MAWSGHSEPKVAVLPCKNEVNLKSFRQNGHVQIYGIALIYQSIAKASGIRRTQADKYKSYVQ